MNGRRAAPHQSNSGADRSTVSRRALLTATTGLTVSTSGCVRRLQNLVTRNNIKQLSLTITTLPDDSDRESIRIANELERVFQTVGINVSFDFRSGIDFLQTVLYDHDFDVCIARHPGGTDPDFLYQALHSLYADESGWQNPFGFTNLTVDAFLEKQRHAKGKNRREAVTDALESIATVQPFVPICIPDEHRLARNDRFDGWGEGHLATRRGYLGLDPAPSVETLRAAHLDPRPTDNLNPLAISHRGRGTFTELLYDSLATDDPSGDITPWLAKSWEWDGRTADIRLHDWCEFHDGEPVTAADVRFTYRFLQDMSLGNHEVATPAPRYRGQVEAVESVDVRGPARVKLTVETSPAVGERAFLVPILPAHIWRERTVEATGPGGVSLAQGTTKAMVTNNVPPVGSGPYQFVDRTEGDQLTLERFESHFTLQSDVDLPEPTVDEVSIDISPNSKTAIRAVENGVADVTTSSLESNVIDTIGDSDTVELLESPSWTFYCLGFNARKAPFSNPRFRRVIAQLIDKEWLVENIFHGAAQPIATPVTSQWMPKSLEWHEEDPETPFLGSDGEVDENAARSAFEAAGFRYDERGRLRVRQ